MLEITVGCDQSRVRAGLVLKLWRSALVPGRSKVRMLDGVVDSSGLPTRDDAVAGDGHTPGLTRF